MIKKGTSGIVFAPSSRAYKELYPELKTIPEFVGLSDKELEFCWWVSCPCSPLSGWPEKEKYKAAVKKCFNNSPVAVKYIQGEFSKGVEIGMARMAKFLPNHRVAARNMAEGAFRKVEEVMKYPSGIITLNQKRIWLETVVKAFDKLPTMVRILEEGFGINEEVTKMEEDRKRIIPDEVSFTDIVKEAEKEEEDVFRIP